MRRIPIGAVGANFEARPNVAVDVAGQLLKSLNGARPAHRRRGAADGDGARRRRAAAGARGGGAAAGGGRPRAHAGPRGRARSSSRCRDVLPLVILRGSGETTAALAREAAQHGVRTLAHAEGGGVLYVDAAADPAKAEALVEASLDRLGVCNRLNLLLVDREAAALLPELLAALERLGIEVREPERLGHEWANDARARRVRHRTRRRLARRRGRARERRDVGPRRVDRHRGRGRRAGASSTRYRGTAAFWNATTRFTDGFALTGSPETGINVDRVPGPRGPVTYRDLYLRQYRVVGDGTQHR